MWVNFVLLTHYCINIYLVQYIIIYFYYLHQYENYYLDMAN